MAAAFRVVATAGVEAATTRRICAEAQMSLASFHYAFDSRDALLEALVISGLSSEDTAVHAVLAASPDTAHDSPADIGALLRGGLHGYVDSVVADPEREQAMVALAQYARRTPGLETLAADTYTRYYALAARALTTAADAAGVRWRTPPADLAPLVVAATDGLTLAYLNTGDVDVARRIADACVAMLLTHVEQP
ncbi:TetR/AcrR family transcriptional regulator [Williamsia deligens]|uniref:TetR/AcrR family transcriptional regulator n=1 Tax=Williamsia deligens TaxID=321325 RepID=A0ABW3G2E4_9NOCA|nr:TetR family transcriptional regulator [Williamsia deligens]MCP2194624.1 transcriptional regulator, TetR family [Williamsia deligens]